MSIVWQVWHQAPAIAIPTRIEGVKKYVANLIPVGRVQAPTASEAIAEAKKRRLSIHPMVRIYDPNEQ